MCINVQQFLENKKTIILRFLKRDTLSAFSFLYTE